MRERSRQRILRQGVRTPDQAQWDRLKAEFGVCRDGDNKQSIRPTVGSEIALPDGVWRLGFYGPRTWLISVRDHVVVDYVTVGFCGSGEHLYVFPDGRLDATPSRAGWPWHEAVRLDQMTWHYGEGGL